SCGRGMPRELQIARRAFALDEDTPFADLIRLRRAAANGRRACGYTTEMRLGAPQHIVALDVTDHDQRGIIRNVVPAVVPVQVLARHRPEIFYPSDGRMAIWMRPERSGRHFRVEQLVGVVLSTLQLRDDHRALRFALLGLV